MKVTLMLGFSRRTLSVDGMQEGIMVYYLPQTSLSPLKSSFNHRRLRKLTTNFLVPAAD